MQLPAIALQVPFFPTVMTYYVSLTSTASGTSVLRSTQHHGRRALITRIAVLADVPRDFPLPTTTTPTSIHTATTAKLATPPPLRLINPLSK